nr:hypothetical protein [Nocardia caishijiensis]
MIAAWVPFADLDQVSALAVVALGVLGYTGYQLALAFGVLPSGVGVVATARSGRRVRQQYRLVSRSFLEISGGGRTVWQPVFYDPALSVLTPTDLEITSRAILDGPTRFFPAGRARTTEPPGKLVDNPTRPTEAPTFTPVRRLVLDAQSTVAAPFAGLLWVYVMNGGLPAFIGATTVAAAIATWLAAIRGSDPS